MFVFKMPFNRLFADIHALENRWIDTAVFSSFHSPKDYGLVFFEEYELARINEPLIGRIKAIECLVERVESSRSQIELSQCVWQLQFPAEPRSAK